MDFISEYSDAELMLIEQISPHWRNVIEQCFINPPNLYDILAKEAFINDKKGPEFDALRKVCIACKKSSPYRLTPEFDDLCSF
jgi:hypothetical protein